MAITDPGEPSTKDMASVGIAIGVDCVVLYFHGPDPVSGIKLALFLFGHAALAGLFSWDPFDAAEEKERQRVMSTIRNSRVGFEPQHEMGAEVFEQRKSKLCSRLKDQLETRRCIARSTPAEAIAWSVKKMEWVVATNRDVAKLQRRLQVAGELCLGEDGKEEHSETMTEVDEVPHARFPEVLLSTRNALLVRFMGLNFPALRAVTRRVVVGGGSTAGGSTRGDSTARRRGMRMRLLAAETCVARLQHEGGALRKAVAQRDEARVAATVASQAVVDLVKGCQKRSKQLVELVNILGKQRLERQESKQESEKHTKMVAEAEKEADNMREVAEGHEEKLKLLRQGVEQRTKKFQTDHEKMEVCARTIWAPNGRRCKRSPVTELEKERLSLHGKLKELTDFAREAEDRIVTLSSKRERQRRDPQESKEESASTEERPNNGLAGGGGRGRGRRGRGPSAWNNGVSSVAPCTLSSRDTPAAVEWGGAISGRVARGSQVGEGVAGVAAPGATRGQASSRGVPVPVGAEPKVPGTGNSVDLREKPIVGVIGRPVLTHARTQQPPAPPGYRLLIREPEDEPYYAVRGTRGIRPEGNTPAASSSTPAVRPHSAQPPAASSAHAVRPPAAQPPAAQPSAVQLPATPARAQPSRAPPGFERMMAPAGGATRCNLGADSAAAVVTSGGGDDDDDGLPRTLEALLIRCDCVQHLERLELKGVTARSAKKLTHDQLKEYGVEEEFDRQRIIYSMQTIEEANDCTFCFIEKSDTMFFPCGHMLLCAGCNTPSVITAYHNLCCYCMEKIQECRLLPRS